MLNYPSHQIVCAFFPSWCAPNKPVAKEGSKEESVWQCENMKYEFVKLNKCQHSMHTNHVWKMQQTITKIKTNQQASIRNKCAIIWYLILFVSLDQKPWFSGGIHFVDINPKKYTNNLLDLIQQMLKRCCFKKNYPQNAICPKALARDHTPLDSLPSIAESTSHSLWDGSDLQKQGERQSSVQQR